MPRSLVSYWKRVAVSGPTADQREITVQELRDCAETYKLSVYTAVIWSEHERWPGSHGTVFAVRLVEDDPELEPGQVALEAQLKPNNKLLQLNDEGEKLFTSVEITPDFAKSGRFYLTGLAVTDSPASLGTQELYFSRGARRGHRYARTSYYCNAVALGSLREGGQPKGEMRRLFSALTGLFKSFAEISGTPDTPSPQEKKPMDEATAKALQALCDQFVILLAGFQAVLEPVVEDVDPADNQEQVDAVGTAVQDVVDQANEDRDYSRNGKGGKGGKGVKELSARIDELQESMTKMFNTTANRRQVQRTTGAQGQKRKGLR
ncbi:GPO family capsid scaffolding protein [Pseudomonas asplenii]|uniref:Phage capsid scaffolding protein (GPO) serine peptidase n=1 Tax=Pseudomonas asplenii TaxID=53407 RepID=A0A1H6MMH8_9PSED|nr:GPO family capsid scaffolding protein [Pseudomonas fuscovaginae]SEH99723.1 Phage capsid scaffolding protein (GPO) serine peptidase [Pseudomonas fuscovaginae]